MAKGLELIVDVDPKLPNDLRGDSLRLGQILINFASNAVKFTEKGSVVVRGRLAEEDERGLLVRFEVQDTGIGTHPRADRQAVPVLLAGRHVDHAQVRGHRPRPRDQQEAGGDDGGRGRRFERAGPRQHVLLHRAARPGRAPLAAAGARGGPARPPGAGGGRQPARAADALRDAAQHDVPRGRGGLGRGRSRARPGRGRRRRPLRHRVPRLAHAGHGRHRGRSPHGGAVALAHAPPRDRDGLRPRRGVPRGRGRGPRGRAGEAGQPVAALRHDHSRAGRRGPAGAGGGGGGALAASGREPRPPPRRARPARRGQRAQPAGRPGAARRGRRGGRPGHERGGGRPARAGEPLRARPDGPADAGDGRLRGDAADPRAARVREAADPRHDRERHGRRPRAVPRRGHERPRDEADRPRRALRGAAAVAARAASRVSGGRPAGAAGPAGPPRPRAGAPAWRRTTRWRVFRASTPKTACAACSGSARRTSVSSARSPRARRARRG